MIERILTQVQAPKLGFLRRVHGLTKGRTEVRLRPGQETSLALPYLSLIYFGIKCPALKKKLVTLSRLFGGAQYFGVLGIAPPSLRPWCDTSRQSAQLLNSQCPECRTTSPKWENIITLFGQVSRMSNGRLVRQALLAKPTGKRPRCRPRPRWSNCIFELAWNQCGTSRTIWNCCCPWGIPSFLWMLPPQPSREENRAWKWMKWITFTSVY